MPPKTPKQIADDLASAFSEIDRLMKEAEAGLGKHDPSECTKELRERLATIYDAAKEAKKAGKYDPKKVAMQVANAYATFTKCRIGAIKRQVNPNA